MIIGSINENKDTEKRISVTPENVKKFIANGFKVYLEKNYGAHLDIDDEKFSENGAEFFDKDKIALSSKLEPKECPWKKHKIDIVFECSGKFNTKSQASGHIKAGAKKVIVSAPCKNADKTVVFGINHKKITKKDKVV